MQSEKQGLNVSVKSFLAAILMILLLMMVTYGLTFVVPGGAYTRVADADGNPVLDPDSFRYTQGGLPLWKWLLSPVLVLGAEGGGMIAAILVFLLVVGRVQQSGCPRAHGLYAGSDRGKIRKGPLWPHGSHQLLLYGHGRPDRLI